MLTMQPRIGYSHTDVEEVQRHLPMGVGQECFPLILRTVGPTDDDYFPVRSGENSTLWPHTIVAFDAPKYILVSPLSPASTREEHLRVEPIHERRMQPILCLRMEKMTHPIHTAKIRINHKTE